MTSYQLKKFNYVGSTVDGNIRKKFLITKRECINFPSTFIESQENNLKLKGENFRQGVTESNPIEHIIKSNLFEFVLNSKNCA